MCPHSQIHLLLDSVFAAGGDGIPPGHYTSTKISCCLFHIDRKYFDRSAVVHKNHQVFEWVEEQTSLTSEPIMNRFKFLSAWCFSLLPQALIRHHLHWNTKSARAKIWKKELIATFSSCTFLPYQHHLLASQFLMRLCINCHSYTPWWLAWKLPTCVAKILCQVADLCFSEKPSSENESQSLARCCWLIASRTNKKNVFSSCTVMRS